MNRPFVSVLSLSTRTRRRFRPWLTWNWAKQGTEGLDIEVLLEDGDGTIAEKRNALLQRAKGDVIVWFDDDDWQHPERLVRGAAALKTGAVAAGPEHAYILAVGAKHAWCYATYGGLIFNGTTFRADVARRVPFGPADDSDTQWTRDVCRQGETRILASTFAWLSHGQNTCLHPEALPLRGILRPTTLGEVRRVIGAQAWRDTDIHLEALHEREAA